MGIVDKVMGSLSNNETRQQYNTENTHRQASGPESLADGKPAEVVRDDVVGGTHTRNVNEAVVHENVSQHAHHEVTPIVNRERDEVDIHQKIQPVVDSREQHTHHQHVAPEVHRYKQEDIDEAAAAKYRQQAGQHNEQRIGEQTHSTSVNAPKVHEHVNKHIIEEVTPVIERQTQQTEHHHTIQNIKEDIAHAPVVHDTTVNAPISIQEFEGKGAGIGRSHGPKDVITDERRA